MKKEEIKFLIYTMEKAIDEIAASMNFDMNANISKYQEKDPSAGDIAKFELSLFLMYLAASDGKIDWNEASLISDLCDMNYTVESISEYIVENNVYSTEFEKEVPSTLQMAVLYDNKKIENGLRSDAVADLPSIMTGIYRFAAEAIMHLNGRQDEHTLKNCQIYLNMMEEFINDHSIRRNTVISGFTKKNREE